MIIVWRRCVSAALAPRITELRDSSGGPTSWWRLHRSFIPWRPGPGSSNISKRSEGVRRTILWRFAASGQQHCQASVEAISNTGGTSQEFPQSFAGDLQLADVATGRGLMWGYDVGSIHHLAFPRIWKQTSQNKFNKIQQFFCSSLSPAPTPGPRPLLPSGQSKALLCTSAAEERKLSVSSWKSASAASLAPCSRRIPQAVGQSWSG